MENKLFSWSLVALLLSLPITTGVLTADSVLDGYWDLAGQSKLVAVSSVDLLILTAASACLIPRDYQLRTQGDDNDTTGSTRATQIAVLTLLAPALGAALYCALRPPLPEE